MFETSHEESVADMPALIAHEWIAPHGGAENVAEALAGIYTDADIVTLWNDAPHRFPRRRIRESWIARTPLRRSKAAALPFMPATWLRFDTRQYDFVVVSSHLFAHHIGGEYETQKFAYIHTPARAIWAPEQDTRGANPLARTLAPALKQLDKSRVTDTTSYAANSSYIAERIARTWEQPSTVIYPPIDLDRLLITNSDLDFNERLILESLPATFVLGASRFVPYKRLDLVISAGNAADIPVVLAGDGPERQRLERLAAEARVPVRVLGSVSDSLLTELYRRAWVYVFPSIEDFGIMPVEAMASGTPTIVYAEGGSAESVRILNGGIVVDERTPDALAEAIPRAASLPMAGIADRARETFGLRRFEREIRNWTQRKDTDL